MKTNPLAQPWFRLRWLLPLIGLLLLAFAAVIWFDNALNRGIDYTPDPEPIPWTDGPQVGVNVYNLQAEPDPTAVRRTLELASEMGVRSIRLQVPWEDIEIHGRGDFTDRRNTDTIGVVSAWAKYDRIVELANELDLELIMRVDRPPAWARQVNIAQPFFQEGLQEDPNSTGPPDDFEEYGRFLRILVERYEGQVRFFQLWNEPNLKNEWNWHTPDPESFLVLLKVGYTAVKEANPDAVVIFPSLAPVDGLDKRAHISELEYLDQIYQAGGAGYFDIMSAQLYGLGQPPDEHRYVRLISPTSFGWSWRQPVGTRADVSRVVLLREIMERHGDSHKPIWVGEFGWNSAPDSIPEWRRNTWGTPVSEEQKADYIVGLVERARNEWPWMGVMNVWKLRHGGYREPDPEDPTPYFSLVRRDWTLLPAYLRLQSYLAQPPVAGLGAHTWQHPAVERLPDGWRLQFSGQRITLVGLAAENTRVTVDDTEVSPQPATLDGAPALVIEPPTSADEHVLEISTPEASAPSRFVVARAPPLPLWLWTLLPALLIGLLVLSGAAAAPLLFARAHGLLVRTPPARLGWQVWLKTPGGEWALLVAMLAGLLIFYGFTNDLPTRLLGIAVFGLFACLRPDLALLFALLTVPLFFMPKGIWDDRFGLSGDGVRVPLHEIALLVVAGATTLRWLLARLLPATATQPRARFRWRWQAVVPPALFFLAGTAGLLVADQTGPALREWRWLIFEPLLFYLLLHYHGSHQPAIDAAQPALDIPRYQVRVLIVFISGGALVGLLGILQFLGLNLVPLLGEKVTFSSDQILVEGVRRVNSVYGHPNNLGLFMGRVWPLALVLALAAFVAHQAPYQKGKARIWQIWQRYRLSLYCMLCWLLTAGGLLVSFSKGALLGAAGALIVLVVLLWQSAAMRSGISSLSGRLSSVWVRTAGVFIGLLLITIPFIAAAAPGSPLERLNPLGESTEARLKLWQSSLAMVQDYPVVGIGLDQFLATYQEYIDPSLVGTNEEFTSHPHNLVLNIWLRLGILGLVACGWLLIRFYRQVLQGRSATLLQCGLAAAMTAALLHGLVDNFYFVPDLAFTFWLLVWLSDG